MKVDAVIIYDAQSHKDKKQTKINPVILNHKYLTRSVPLR